MRGLPAGPLLFGPSEPASPESETPYVKFYFGRHFSSVRSSRPRGQKFRARAALALGNLAPASVASGTSCPSGGACDALFAIRFRPGVLVLTPLRSSRGIRPCACKRCARAEFRMISPRGRTNPPACRRNPTEAPARRAYSKFFQVPDAPHRGSRPADSPGDKLWEGTNPCDEGLDLSGSWQQGHSATYNAPSRI